METATQEKTSVKEIVLLSTFVFGYFGTLFFMLSQWITMHGAPVTAPHFFFLY